MTICRTMLNGEPFARRRVLEAEARPAAASAAAVRRSTSAACRRTPARPPPGLRRLPDVAGQGDGGRRSSPICGAARREVRPRAEVRLPRPHDRPRDRGRGARRGRPAAVEAGRGEGEQSGEGADSTSVGAARQVALRQRRPTTAMPRRTCGPAWAAPAPAAAPPSSAIRTRCWPSSRTTAWHRGLHPVGLSACGRGGPVRPPRPAPHRPRPAGRTRSSRVNITAKSTANAKMTAVFRSAWA